MPKPVFDCSFILASIGSGKYVPTFQVFATVIYNTSLNPDHGLS